MLTWLLDVDVDTFPNWVRGFTFIKVCALCDSPKILAVRHETKSVNNKC